MDFRTCPVLEWEKEWERTMSVRKMFLAAAACFALAIPAFPQGAAQVNIDPFFDTLMSTRTVP
jgi:hypothetical protein